MLCKAKKSFAGVVSMSAGQVKDLPDESIVKDLLRVGYIEKVSPTKEVKEPAEQKTETTKKPTKRGKK